MMTRLFYLWTFFQCVTVLIEVSSENDNEMQYYEYTLDADGRYLEGRIQDDAQQGSRVPVIEGNIEGKKLSNPVTNLKIIIKENINDINRKTVKSNNGTSSTGKDSLPKVTTSLLQKSNTSSTTSTSYVVPTAKTRGSTLLETREITQEGNSVSITSTTTISSDVRQTSTTGKRITSQVFGSMSTATGNVEISSNYNITSSNVTSSPGTGRKRRGTGNTGNNEINSMAELLLKNLTIRVRDTETFDVDEFFFIIVNDSSKLKDSDMDEFFVILCATDGREVSTPVPFVVRINHNVQVDTSSGYPAAAAIFSGALLLLIIFLALLIPLVTRAKRRYKAGKPLFKLGSHPSSADLKVKRKIQRDTSEPNWYGNNTYNYVEEVEMGKAEFTSTIKDIESQREGHSEVSSHKKSVAE